MYPESRPLAYCSGRGFQLTVTSVDLTFVKVTFDGALLGTDKREK